MKYLRKYWFIILIIFITIIRFFLSYQLPNYYLNNLQYDDYLMVNEASSIVKGLYLGKYSDVTLVKGLIYPLILSLSILTHIRMSTMITIIYILSCIYFINSFKKVTNNKIILLLAYIVILFNPISYSAESFQRLYLTSLLPFELLLFIGAIINILYSKKNNIINYIILGLIISIMFLTRDDAIWTIVIYLLIIIYKLYKKFDIKSILKCITPIIVLVFNLNIVSYINYKHYNIYNYSEIMGTYFKKTYSLILKIKDDNSTDQVSITKNMLYKLSDNIDMFLTRDEIDEKYKKLNYENDEINNAHMIWFLRRWIYNKYTFTDGREANEYYKKLYFEIDKLFKKGIIDKKFNLSLINIDLGIKNELKELPSSIIKAICYSSSYKNVIVFSAKNLKKINNYHYIFGLHSYSYQYKDYLHSENAIKDNIKLFEVIRIIYKYFTIIFSVCSIFIYVFNLFKKDKLNVTTHLIFISYIIILLGVTYTHVSSFYAITYRYLSCIYLLQNIFIMLNIERFRMLLIRKGNKK